MSAQQRADESESNLRQLTAQHELHAAGLEARLAELSENVGSIERLRQQDQITIQKLRERLVQVNYNYEHKYELKGNLQRSIFVGSFFKSDMLFEVISALLLVPSDELK